MPTTLLNGCLGLLQGVAIIAGAPMLIGFLRWCKARFQGQQGPSPLQPYLDLRKLLWMPPVRPGTTSIVFAVTPCVLFAVYGTLAFAAPLFAHSSLLAGDLWLFIYLLALARFILSLAGLDAGAPFTGLGSSREMFLHFLTEIGLALFVTGLALRWRATDFKAILGAHWDLGFSQFIARPELILLALALGLLILFEAERIPIDNPATHLELTMAHRAITLEFAGRDLGILEWAEMVKLAVLLALFGGLFLPFPAIISPFGSGLVAIFAAALGAFVRTFLLVVVLAAWEMAQPKLRFRAATGPALGAMVLSLTAILYVLTLGSLRR